MVFRYEYKMQHLVFDGARGVLGCTLHPRDSSSRVIGEGELELRMESRAGEKVEGFDGSLKKVRGEGLTVSSSSSCASSKVTFDV